MPSDSTFNSDAATASLSYAWDRQWFEYWQYVLWRTEYLEAYLNGSLSVSKPTTVSKFLVADCCLALDNMLEWIQFAQGVTDEERMAIQVSLNGNHLVAETRDVANTLKHYGRDPGKRFARVSSLGGQIEELGKKRTAVEITFLTPDGSTHTCDGLDLVRDMRDRIRTAIKDAGLTDPYIAGSGLPLS